MFEIGFKNFPIRKRRIYDGIYTSISSRDASSIQRERNSVIYNYNTRYNFFTSSENSGDEKNEYDLVYSKNRKINKSNRKHTQKVLFPNLKT